MGTKEKAKIGETLTIEDAKIAMAQYADAFSKLKAIEAVQEQKINAIRESYAREVKSLKDQKDIAFKNLQTYAESNPEDFKDKKSMDLGTGTISFRKGTPKTKLLSGFTWNKVMEKIKTFGWDDILIRTKQEPNKDQMVAWHSDQEKLRDLKSIGVIIVADECFYVESKEEVLTE